MVGKAHIIRSTTDNRIAKKKHNKRKKNKTKPNGDLPQDQDQGNDLTVKVAGEDGDPEESGQSTVVRVTPVHYSLPQESKALSDKYS